MPPIELDLPEIIPGLDQWGGKNTAALLTLLQAVNSTIASLDVRAGHLWSIHTDGTETDLGSLPVGPPGGVNKVANLQGDIGAQQLVDAIAGPLSAQIAQLKVWARNLDQLIVGAVTRNGNGAATSAPVKWPDGSPGTYTATTLSTAFPGAVDAYTVTYGNPVTRTITQPAVTRDTNGAVTNLPELTVA